MVSSPAVAEVAAIGAAWQRPRSQSSVAASVPAAEAPPQTQHLRGQLSASEHSSSTAMLRAAAAAAGSLGAAALVRPRCKRAAGAVRTIGSSKAVRASAGWRQTVSAGVARHVATIDSVGITTQSLDEKGRFRGQFVPEPNPAFLKSRLEIWDRLWAKSQEELAARERKPIKITLPDGSVQEGESWSTTPLDIAEGISKGLAQNSVVAYVTRNAGAGEDLGPCLAAADGEDDDEEDDDEKGELWDMTRPLEGDCTLELIKFSDDRGRNVFWHSSCHVMGAVLEENMGGLLTIGPAVSDGFYYDMYLGDKRISESDYATIEKSVTDLKKEDVPFQRIVISREDALELFADNPFKVDLIQRKVAPGSLTTAYRCGKCLDLCRGPHLPSSGRVGSMWVTKNSSAYWLGSADNDSLQRVYGVSFPSSKELKAHKKRVAEAKERDHRRIGNQQDLFFFNSIVSPGSCFWTNYGTRIYNKLQNLLRAEYRYRGFEEVITPNIYSSELFKRSGHYQNYRDDMYGFKVEGQEWFLKPMNCPGHCIMFDSKVRSYRELPMRLASFGVLHRNELSGTLSGLTRVRRFQQDDAHIFCRDDQITAEVSAALKFVFDMYELFGFKFSMALSTRPKKALGSQELWDRAEEQLKVALNGTGKEWTVNKADGAFYGPKIDIKLLDALGRGHQCGTVQLDFQLPLRFNLKYQTEGGSTASESSSSGSEPSVSTEERAAPADMGDSPPALLPGYARPVMVHRAILGSVERMIGVLAEHFSGKWPFWLSPRQCMVVPVSDDAFEYAKYVRDTLMARGLHAEVDLADTTMKKKIREAQVSQWNYIMIVGKGEEEKTSVNLRMRGMTEPVGERDLAELVSELEEENRPKALAKPASVEPFQRST